MEYDFIRLEFVVLQPLRRVGRTAKTLNEQQRRVLRTRSFHTPSDYSDTLTSDAYPDTWTTTPYTDPLSKGLHRMVHAMPHNDPNICSALHRCTSSRWVSLSRRHLPPSISTMDHTGKLLLLLPPPCETNPQQLRGTKHAESPDQYHAQELAGRELRVLAGDEFTNMQLER